MTCTFYLAWQTRPIIHFANEIDLHYRSRGWIHSQLSLHYQPSQAILANQSPVSCVGRAADLLVVSATIQLLREPSFLWLLYVNEMMCRSGIEAPTQRHLTNSVMICELFWRCLAKFVPEHHTKQNIKLYVCICLIKAVCWSLKKKYLSII